MKPQRFEIGQAVTPKAGTTWKAYFPTKPLPKADIYHVSAYRSSADIKKQYPDATPRSGWFISLIEFGADRWMFEEKFDPVITDSQLEELLREVPQTETVR